MARAASFALIPGGRHEGESRSGVGKLEGRPLADRVLTDLSQTFALDIDQVQAEAKWSLGRTLTLTILLSAALWILIAGTIYII